MTTPDHNESKPRRRWPTYLAIVLVLLFVVYPLSSGPTVILLLKFPQLEPAYVIFYYPLAIFAESVRADQLLIGYMLWWGGFVGPIQSEYFYFFNCVPRYPRAQSWTKRQTNRNDSG